MSRLKITHKTFYKKILSFRSKFKLKVLWVIMSSLKITHKTFCKKVSFRSKFKSFRSNNE